ncbi:hypothetical protein [Sulfurospirillum halorespirans]|uniref:Uncharacterized protein n=1 Tax=Sulfurospirillum halorespirans DSM 13726 TaxID=1193502 RepID=A0A1D7THT6_9BACT|nr:hypothetical protein [Sulfurospirillum halorespirans]AOO64543.1 hypothetical protein SHALO_0760 [Sulfurospirillum halorespirans DSM 13726]
MILYDKSGLFLGMGSQELYLLGYEDMEEFRNYHSDIADLFINKPGFIFKFKNFCWIDYAQHSGTPNKRVLIRTKNGKEIESSLLINEIYLQKELNNTSLFYSVELSNAPSFKRDLPISMNTPQNFDTTLEEPTPSITSYEESFSEEAPLAQTAPISFETTQPSMETAFEEDYTASLPTPMISLSETEAAQDFKLNTSAPLLEDTFDFKLKFDHTILDEPKEDKAPKIVEETPEAYHSIDQITLHDLDFTAPVEFYPEDQVEDLLDDPTLHVEELRAPSDVTPLVEEETFDLSECAEELGLDISTLAQIIEEYVISLDTSLPRLKDAINANNRHQAKEEISHLKSVALHLQILSLFHQFEHLETSLDFDTKEEILHTLQSLQKAVSHFKENVL